MPALKPKTILPSEKEDKQMTVAAYSDLDNIPLTDQEWEQIKPHVSIGKKISTQRISINFDTEIIEYFRTTGHDWQQKIHDALHEWLKEHAV